MAAGFRPEVVFALANDTESARLAEAHDIELAVVDDRALARLADTKSPRGPVAVLATPDTQVLSTGRSALVSWGVRDPGNVGSMIRTAAAFGWDFAYSPGTADPWSPKVLRSASGGHFKTGIAEVEGVSELASAGLTLVATLVRGGVDPVDVPSGRLAVLIGEEASGLPEDVVEAARIRVTIPMPGHSESLNAAVAAGILVHQLSRGRDDDVVRGEGGQAL